MGTSGMSSLRVELPPAKTEGFLYIWAKQPELRLGGTYLRVKPAPRSQPGSARPTLEAMPPVAEPPRSPGMNIQTRLDVGKEGAHPHHTGGETRTDGGRALKARCFRGCRGGRRERQLLAGPAIQLTADLPRQRQGSRHRARLHDGQTGPWRLFRWSSLPARKRAPPRLHGIAKVRSRWNTWAPRLRWISMATRS